MSSTNPHPDVSVALLHGDMVNKHNHPVTTSLTVIDVHDLARSCRTYGATSLYISHPSEAIQKLAQTLHNHWQDGFGAKYNPNRREALERVRIVCSFDEAIADITNRAGKAPILVATSARDGGKRITFDSLREQLPSFGKPVLIMLGTGWGMSEGLLARADLFLEPIKGPTDYNHLSVRSACAIMLDRIFGI